MFDTDPIEQRYLADHFRKERPFPAPLPPISWIFSSKVESCKTSLWQLHLNVNKTWNSVTRHDRGGRDKSTRFFLTCFVVYGFTRLRVRFATERKDVHIEEVITANLDKKKRSLITIRRCSLTRGSFPAKIAWWYLRVFSKKRCSLYRGVHNGRFYCS